MARCLLTACRVIDAPDFAKLSQSAFSVWPLRANSRSSNSLRLASASALNTASMGTICNHLVACQAIKNAAQPRGIWKLLIDAGSNITGVAVQAAHARLVIAAHHLVAESFRPCSAGRTARDDRGAGHVGIARHRRRHVHSGRR